MRALALLTLLAAPAAAQPPPLAEADRVRLAEVFRLGAAVRDDVVWAKAQGTAAPFDLLLVGPEHEYFVGSPHLPLAPDGFEPLGHDSLLGMDVHARPRTFPPNLLATFPAVGGRSTIVIGQPEATGKTSTAWVLTVLHERAHQLQASRPGYYEGVAALDLAGGDETGMWMLNYPFPYDHAPTAARFRAYRDALAGALAAVGTDAFGTRVSALSTARRRFHAGLAPRDARYFAFQLWQEGVARYTEHLVAGAAVARGYTPSPAFAALDDFTPYPEAAEALRAGLMRELAEADLPGWRRVAFYAVGAAEALVLDAVRPDWQRRYLPEPFDLAAYYSDR